MRQVQEQRRLLARLQERLGFKFENEQLLVEAMTHPSFVGEGDSRLLSNQRLEFLGDSVLGLIIGEFLFQRHPELAEGDLTKMKAFAVSEVSLVQAARALELGDYLLLGRGEEASGGRARPSILADAFEALAGAIYLEGGLAAAREFIVGNLTERIALIESRRHVPDFKSLLQERLQAEGRGTPTYRVIETSGPDHSKRFVVEVAAREGLLGRGEGGSKKAAEQAAAAAALEREQTARHDAPDLPARGAQAGPSTPKRRRKATEARAPEVGK